MRIPFIGVRVDASTGNAHPHPQPESQVRDVWQGVLASVAAAGPHAIAHRREALRLRPVRKGIRRSLQPPSAHADTFHFEAFPVSQVGQAYFSEHIYIVYSS